MIAVRLHDGDTITVDADPEDVKLEGGTLTIRRDNLTIARFGRHTAWWETTDNNQ